jgi:hypothetical protein
MVQRDRSPLTLFTNCRGIAAALIANGALKTDVAVENDAIFQLQLGPPFNTYCESLGNPTRVGELAPGRNGALLAEALAADGYLTLRSFAEWWFAEDFAMQLHSFVTLAFPDVTLLERSTAHSFRYWCCGTGVPLLTAAHHRYRVPTAELTLSQVFEKFEDARERVNIEGYSVGQTTLEQIFNQVSITRARVQSSERGFTHSLPLSCCTCSAGKLARESRGCCRRRQGELRRSSVTVQFTISLRVLYVTVCLEMFAQCIHESSNWKKSGTNNLIV